MLGRIVLAVAILAALSPAQKQRGNNNNSNTMGDYRPARKQSKFELFADKLKLNKEQRDEAINVMNAALEESIQTRQALDKARQAMASAVIFDKGEEEFQKAMDEYTSDAVQMTGFEAKAFSKIYAGLKPNQQTKAGQAFDLLAQVLEGASGGRGRGGERK